MRSFVFFLLFLHWTLLLVLVSIFTLSAIFFVQNTHLLFVTLIPITFGTYEDRYSFSSLLGFSVLLAALIPTFIIGWFLIPRFYSNQSTELRNHQSILLHKENISSLTYRFLKLQKVVENVRVTVSLDTLVQRDIFGISMTDESPPPLINLPSHSLRDNNRTPKTETSTRPHARGGVGSVASNQTDHALASTSKTTRPTSQKFAKAVGEESTATQLLHGQQPTATEQKVKPHSAHDNDSQSSQNSSQDKTPTSTGSSAVIGEKQRSLRSGSVY